MISGKKTRSWTPIKISKRRIRVADSKTSDDEISCLSLDYQVVNGSPGFEVEMNDDLIYM